MPQVSLNKGGIFRKLSERRVEQGEVVVFPDGSIRFVPVFNKREARFFRNARERFGAMKVCEDCSHFIGGGGCHVVRGEINPNDRCFEFFADVGIFADREEEDGGVDISLILWGERFDWDGGDVEEFLKEVRERIEQHSGA